jgi:GntR family transcriptional repressor for pyruvate dehydrogenase complex
MSDRSSRATGAERRYLAIAQQLLEAINRGDYEVGQRLPTDREIALRCGVSRPTVREALLVLELVGIVQATAGAGVFVASAIPRLRGQNDALLAAPADLIESRILIEPSVAGLCAARPTSAAVNELCRLVQEAEAAARSSDRFPRFSDLSLEFHAALGRHCGNKVLSCIVEQLVEVQQHPLWVLLNQSVLRDQNDLMQQVDQHRLIMEAIARGDQAAAISATERHLQELSGLILGRDGQSHRSAELSMRDASRRQTATAGRTAEKLR